GPVPDLPEMLQVDESQPPAEPRRVENSVLREAAIDKFATRFGVRQQGDSSVIAINFTDPDPKLAAAAVNSAADQYVQWQLEEKLDEANRLSVWVRERLIKMAEEVQQSEAAVEAYRSTEGLINNERDGRFRQEEMIEFNREAAKYRTELADLEAQLRVMRRLQANGDTQALSGMLASPVLATLIEEELRLLSEEAELATSFGERHPSMQLLKTEQARVADRIAQEVERLVVNAERDAAIARARLAQITDELDSRRSEGYRLSDAEVGMRELQRQAEANQQVYLLLLERYKEVNEQQDIIESDVRIVSLAKPPTRPSSLSPKLFTLVGFVTSFSGSALLALLLEGMNRLVRSARQIERIFDIKVLDAVPHVKRAGKSRAALLRYLLDRPRSAYAEALRAIYATLRLSAGSDTPRTIMVSSSLSGEGKTTFASSLAITASQWGQTVLVLDLDLHHPQIATATRVKPTVGIAEIIEGKATVDEAITKTGLGFDIIGVVKSPANTSGLIGDQRMPQLLRELQQRYDLVIVDTAPILAVSDGRVASALVDLVVVVTRWNMAPLSALRRTLQMLRDAHANIAGIALLSVNEKEYLYYESEDGSDYRKNLKKYYQT
ncbi:MAG: AAA family ATPase, partial [Pseudomonadota bacterium]